MATTPLWQQVLDDLERRIACGELDTRFPTDRELVATYGVSRHTVREAVRRLRQRGVLDRHPGRGSFLRGREFTQPVGALYSLFRAVEAAGLEQRSQVLGFEVTTDDEAAGLLNLEKGTPLVRLERLRFAGDEPLALDVAWLPEAIAAPLLDADFSRTALYDELDERCGVRLTSGAESFAPVVPSDRLRTLLGLGQREAVFRVERRGFVDERPVEWRVTLIRGDRFVLTAELDPVVERSALRMVERADP